MADDPRREYETRRAARAELAARLEAADGRLSTARLVVFGLFLVVCWLTWGAEAVAPGWVLLPIAGFLILVRIHDDVVSRRRRAERAVAHYDAGLRRLDDAWSGRGQSGERFLDPEHGYAADLDLFGRGSLFELLATVRTEAGEATLARWLLGPAATAEVRRRQGAVDDLRGRLELREDLALVGEEVRAGLHPEDLAGWGQGEAVAFPTWVVPLARGLVVALLLALAGWAAGGLIHAVEPARPLPIWLGPLPSLLLILGELGLGLWLNQRVEAVLSAMQRPLRGLRVLSGLLARIERERFEAPLLLERQAALSSAGATPSREIARLERLATLVDSRNNQVFAVISMLLLWSTQLAVAIERWRQTHGAELGEWVATTGEIETLAAVGGYAYEHPEDPFPELVDEALPRFEAEAMGHPLLGAKAVANDLALGAGDAAAGPQLLVVSGSNMSGKSTLMRTLGVNVVLAMAGAPVRARRILMTPLAVGASIRILDSLADGTSRFYAEIRRLRGIMDATTGELPLLFLLDEILAGTNSHDRRIGAEAVVRSLVERGAVGLVTTHDLALSRIADDLGEAARNVHFEDRLVEGRMEFDYQLKEGVVRRSNALELMRGIGLEV